MKLKNEDAKIWMLQMLWYTQISQLIFFQADYEQHYIIFNPTSCSNPENCQGANIRPVKTAANFNYKDYQEIKIQVQYMYFSFKISDCPWSLILNAVHSTLCNSCVVPLWHNSGFWWINICDIFNYISSCIIWCCVLSVLGIALVLGSRRL